MLASRADPPLPLARLRARGQLIKLRAADLRFTVAEATVFIHQLMQLPLSQAQGIGITISFKNYYAINCTGQMRSKVLSKMMTDAGLTNVCFYPLTFGLSRWAIIACLGFKK